MTRVMILLIGVMALARPGLAGTFDPVSMPDGGPEAFTRTEARTAFGRDLLGEPYATAVIGRVDVYDRFPYLETHTFQIVSDPAWNRLLFGESGRGVGAFDGVGTEFGALSGPRGLAVDDRSRLYVADTGNDRVLVFETRSEFDRLELVPLYAITGLSRPLGVAVSDGGTALAPGDDRLYVADAGRNRVVAFALEERAARMSAEVGGLGSGVGRFAGPTAITVVRGDGTSAMDLLVSDAHNQRLVRLRDRGDRFDWIGDAPLPEGRVTSLDSDPWGNLYAASPSAGVVTKFSPDLERVDALEGLDHPLGFHVPFMTVTDHRTGRAWRSGEGSGLVVEAWNASSGIRRMKLGVEVRDLAVREESDEATFLLTDRAQVRLDLLDAVTGTVLSSRDAGMLDAGSRSASWDEPREAGTAGARLLRVTAVSAYDDGGSAKAEFALSGGNPPVGGPSRSLDLASHPNPFNPRTTLYFDLPSGTSGEYVLRVYTPDGRLVSTLASGVAGSGRHAVAWDGRDDRGRDVASGAYVARLETERGVVTTRMVLVR